jgi:hypothetical protein
MDETVQKILIDLLLAVLTAMGGYAVWWIKSKTTLVQRRKVEGIVMVAVQAVELLGAQLGWSGAAKKEEVIKRVLEITKISREELDTLIENAVYLLKTWEQELVKQVNKSTGVSEIIVKRTVMETTLKKGKTVG